MKFLLHYRPDIYRQASLDRFLFWKNPNPQTNTVTTGTESFSV